jgi:hypothetical protein
MHKIPLNRIDFWTNLYVLIILLRVRQWGDFALLNDTAKGISASGVRPISWIFICDAKFSLPRIRRRPSESRSERPNYGTENPFAWFPDQLTVAVSEAGSTAFDT